MNHAYTSFNKAVQAAWAVIAAGVAVEFDTPDDAIPLAAACLRVYWESHGQETEVPDQYEAQIDLAIFVPPLGNQPQVALALTRASALDKAMGFAGTTDGSGGTGSGTMARYDYTVTPAAYLSEMTAYPDHGWVAIPTQSPGQVRLARTVILRYRTNTGAAFG